MPQDGQSQAVFDLSDLEAIREEYEERITLLERERGLALEGLRRDYEQRMATLQHTHAQQRATEAIMRQELIEELTIELATAREDGEVRVLEANKKRVDAEAQLMMLRNHVAKLESDAAQVRKTLDAFLEPQPASVVEAFAVPMEPPASIVHVPATPPHGTPVASAPVAAAPEAPTWKAKLPVASPARAAPTTPAPAAPARAAPIRTAAAFVALPTTPAKATAPATTPSAWTLPTTPTPATPTLSTPTLPAPQAVETPEPVELRKRKIRLR